jgi:hypothetical protein
MLHFNAPGGGFSHVQLNITVLLLLEVLCCCYAFTQSFGVSQALRIELRRLLWDKQPTMLVLSKVAKHVLSINMHSYHLHFKLLASSTRNCESSANSSKCYEYQCCVPLS